LAVTVEKEGEWKSENTHASDVPVRWWNAKGYLHAFLVSMNINLEI
jgi:hypothetical protein